MAAAGERPLTNVDCLAQHPASASTEDKLDRELIARIQNHDRDAFRELYFRYHRRLARFLTRRTRNYADAEEIINDTLWIVWKSAAAFRHESRVSTWIMGIAYRCGLKMFRSAARHERAMQLEIAEGEATAPDALQATEERQMLKRAIAELPLEQRLVLEFAYYLDHSCEEIAEIMECPVNTVKARMFRARLKLRAILVEDNSVERLEDSRTEHATKLFARSADHRVRSPRALPNAASCADLPRASMAYVSTLCSKKQSH
jgi:RNA polymerase sigma-70 factor (ECF subfamily)